MRGFPAFAVPHTLMKQYTKALVYVKLFIVFVGKMWLPDRYFKGFQDPVRAFSSQSDLILSINLWRDLQKNGKTAVQYK